MTLFRSDTHRAVWQGHWCDRCVVPAAVERRSQGLSSGCPILTKALASKRKPVEWDRNTRAQTMDAEFRCNAYLDRPAVDRRGTAEDQTMTMFDVTPTIEGVDHA